MTFFKKTTFSSGEELFSFLRKENNTYSQFFLEKRNLSNQVFSEKTHIHHIQPEHANGSNESWNQIKLSISDHAKAHLLLFENYQCYYDKSAYHFILHQQTEAYQALRLQIQINMKKNKRGFYDSNLQKNLGSRKKYRKPKSRKPEVVKALEKGFILQHGTSNEIILIKPFEFVSLVQVLDKWFTHPSMFEIQQKWQNCKQKQKFSQYTGLVIMLTGHIDSKTNKKVLTVSGWRVAGIFLDFQYEDNLDEFAVY
jgi:hypothetical protein